MIKQRFNVIVWSLLPVLLLALTGCSSNKAAVQGLDPAPKAIQVELAMASPAQLPAFAQKSEPRVQEAYRFAIANPDIMTQIPCYCGCVNMGHKHVRDCFIKNVKPDGSLEFDNHAAGCGICIDITQDVMHLTRQGQPLKIIRTYVDTKYSQFAPSTHTPPVE